ncbi:MAG: enoyl-[acyl-carrier-protein] reductase FabI [Halobacteriovoraceae bacterium]|nr:enoyl-[acyl-carrier-protein] reductase FabI [Halobacteriovoraceae bacterium]
MGLLQGKKVLVLGVANERSIAWGITKAIKNQGANVALTYLNEQLKKRVEPLAKEVSADWIHEMDVTVDEHYIDLKDKVEKEWGKFDVLVHSLAFANKDDLHGDFSDTSRKGFKMACDISAFSLVGLCHHLKNLMNENGSVISMTYYGSQKVLDGYNVMGVAKAALEASSRYLAYDLGKNNIRVNTISAGPIRTLAASGVKSLRKSFELVEENSPLRRNVTTDDVGGTAVYLASNLSSGVSGQNLFVDAGISSVAIS